MNFKQFLNENADVLQSIPVRPVNEEERELIADLKKVFSIIHGLLNENKDMSVQDISDVISQLQKFSYYKFIENFIAFCKELLASHGKMSNAKTVVKANIGDIKKHSAHIKNAILGGMMGDKSRQTVSDLKAIIDSVDSYVDAPAELKRHLKSVFASSPSFFGSSRLLTELGSRQYEKIESIEETGPLYTALEIPKGKMHDVDYAIYFLLHLQKTPESKKFFSVDTHELRKFQAVKNAENPDYEKLMSLVDVYLHANDKKLIPQIAKLIEKIPSIKEANDKIKNGTKHVYRGLGFSEDENPDLKEVLEQDRANKYVATTTSFSAAKNFALQKGHLEDEDQRRSGTGIILTYGVTPDAILFDTRVLATVYNESEIVIDATKAELVEEEEI